MRVGIDGRSLAGGSGRGIAHYTSGLLEALTTAHPGDDWRVLVPAGAARVPPGASVRRSRVPHRILYGAGAALGKPRLDRLLGEIDVFFAPAPAPLAVSRRVPLVLAIHDLSFEQRPRDYTAYERAWHRTARPGRLARRAVRVLSDSGATRTEAIERWRLDARRVVVAAPGVRAPTQLPSDAEIAAARQRHALPLRYLLYVGALEPRKAPGVLAAAFALSRRDGLDAALAVVGEGRCRETLAGPGVHLLGRVSDSERDALYAGALALVLPSWLEGFGFTPLEAALRGTPAIVSHLPALRETLGDAALRVAPGDASALATAMRRIAAEPDLRATLAAAAGRAAVRFTWERCAQRTYAALLQAAQT